MQSYKLGFGIMSLQAKESKHLGVKQDLSLANRSCSKSNVGKWWRLMQTNYEVKSDHRSKFSNLSNWK